MYDEETYLTRVYSDTGRCLLERAWQYKKPSTCLKHVRLDVIKNRHLMALKPMRIHLVCLKNKGKIIYPFKES